VRIIVVSDSCHGGAVTSGLRFDSIVEGPVAGEMAALAHGPGYRGMPRDVMISTHEANRVLYDGIQDAEPSFDGSENGATVLGLLACQDDQLAREGPRNGLFTGTLLAVWDGGAWKGGHAEFPRRDPGAHAGRTTAELQVVRLEGHHLRTASPIHGRPKPHRGFWRPPPTACLKIGRFRARPLVA
jgi:hypothetical protein